MPVIAKCFALSSVILENLDDSVEKILNSVLLAELILIKNLPKIHNPTSKKTTPHCGVMNSPSPLIQFLNLLLDQTKLKQLSL